MRKGPLNAQEKVLQKLGRLRFLARVVLVLEALISAFWQSSIWIALFLAFWLLDIPGFFGTYGREAFLVVFLAGFVGLMVRNYRNYQTPSVQQTHRRLEQDNNLQHRPISVLNDNLANPDKSETVSLWEAGKTKAIRAIQGLKPALPRSVLPHKDPYAMRMGVVLLLIAGFVVAGPTWPQRIQAGLFPFGVAIPGYEMDGVTLTITPPDYTRKQIVAVKGISKDEILSIPFGSELKAQVHGGFGLPSLWIGERKEELIKIDKSNYGIITKITEGDILAIKQLGIARLKWPYEIIPDTPPTLSVADDYNVTEYSTLRFAFTMHDDYGVRDLHMRMTLDPVVEESPLGDPYEETRAVMSPPGEELAINPTYDLTSHVWAGLPAVLTFTAMDDIGQASSSEIKLVLPERQFQHPVAQKLIEHRKTLAWNYQADPQDIMDSLIDILNHPDGYDGDVLVFLALRTAASRLYYSPAQEDTARALIDLFWKVAIHLEDGDINLAREQLLQAQRELEEALSNPDTTNEEKARLVENLRQALAEYFRELGREMQKQMAEGTETPLLSPDMLNQMIQPEDLARFFDQLESESLSGDPDKARELLSQLSRLMDMLDPSMQMSMPLDMHKMTEGVSELQKLVRRQEELLDQTRQQSDLMDKSYDYGDLLPDDPNSTVPMDNMPPAPQSTQKGEKKSQVNTALNQTEQDALRYILGQLMLEADRFIGEIPDNMGLAEREMLSSSDALGENRPDFSVPHQERAIEHLREAMQDLSQQMMARMREMTGMSLGQAQTDPLGRRTGQDGDGNNWFHGSEVEIPDEAERKKVEEILKFLRKRSGEFNRPDEELDYYRRLLKQF